MRTTIIILGLVIGIGISNTMAQNNDELELAYNRFYHQLVRENSNWRMQAFGGIQLISDNVSNFKPAMSLQFNTYYKISRAFLLGGQLTMFYGTSDNSYNRKGQTVGVTPSIGIIITDLPKPNKYSMKTCPFLELFAGYSLFAFQKAIVNNNADFHRFRRTTGSYIYGIDVGLSILKWPMRHTKTIIKGGVIIYGKSSVYGYEDKHNPLKDVKENNQVVINDNYSSSNSIFLMVGIEF